MKANTKSLKISIAAAVVAIGLPFSASAGQVWDWHGRTEKALVDTLGKPVSQVTNADGTRVYTYVHEHQARNVSAGPRSHTTIRLPAQRHVAEFQIGAEGRVMGARFVDDVTCDLKS